MIAYLSVIRNEYYDDNDDGLSKGAIAGIVLGCVGCDAIISFIIILLCKRKKNEKDKISNSSKK